MIYFADNDIVIKVCACDIVAETMKLLNCGIADVRILRGLRFRTSPIERSVREHGTVAAYRIRDFVRIAREIDEAPMVDDVIIYKGIEKIDPGEQILLASACRDENSIIVTGDKRCLKTLASTPSLAEPLARLQGRIVCFEQVLLGVISTVGFDYVRDKLVDGRNCDGLLRKVVTDNSTNQTS